MTAICSWGGGKDSCLAYWRTRDDYDIREFLTMVVGEGDETILRGYLYALRRQSRAIGAPLREERVTWETYTARFERVLRSLDVEYAVFGTIDVAEHRSWAERICRGCNVTPVFPLWGEDPVELYREFLESGFEAIVVKIDPELIGPRWVGKPLDEPLLHYLLERDVHPMGEHGEYHTFVTDGPVFEHRTELRIVGEDRTAGGLRAELEVPGMGDSG